MVFGPFFFSEKFCVYNKIHEANNEKLLHMFSHIYVTLYLPIFKLISSKKIIMCVHSPLILCKRKLIYTYVDAMGQRERNGKHFSQWLVRSFRKLEKCDNLLTINNLHVVVFLLYFSVPLKDSA